MSLLIFLRWDFRPQDKRLAAHVVSTAANHYHSLVHLLCDVTGTQINGEQEAVRTEAGPHRLQLWRRGLFSLHVLRGKCCFICQQADVRVPLLESQVG